MGQAAFTGLIRHAFDSGINFLTWLMPMARILSSNHP